MAYYSMAFQGMAPFGSLLAGAATDRISAPNTLIARGRQCIAGAAWFGSRLSSLRAVVRPIYVRLGILPELTPQ
jgi:hypothetical protein